jgi:hypothetical protein
MLRKFSTNLLVGLSRMSNHYKSEKVLYNFVVQLRAPSSLQLSCAAAAAILRGGGGQSWATLLCDGGGESWQCSWAVALNRRVLDDAPVRRRWSPYGALGVRINGPALAPGRPDWFVDYFRWRGICQGVLAKVGLHGGGA